MNKTENSQFEKTVFADLNDLIYLYRKISVDKLQAYVVHDLDFGKYYFNGFAIVFESENYKALISFSQYKLIDSSIPGGGIMTCYSSCREKLEFIHRNSDIWYFILRMKEVLQNYDEQS